MSSSQKNLYGWGKKLSDDWTQMIVIDSDSEIETGTIPSVDPEIIILDESDHETAVKTV